MPKKGSRKDIQAGIRQRVRHALLTVAPSEAELVISELLGEGIVVPAIADLTGDLIGGQIINRAGMYPESAFATFQNNVMDREVDEGVTLGRRVLEEGDNCEDCIAAASEEFVPLDELAEIGDSVCQSRCRCEFEFGDQDSSFRTSEIFSGVISGQDQYGGSVEIS